MSFERGPILVELKCKLWQARGRAERGKLCPVCGSRDIGRSPNIISGCFNPGDYGCLCGRCGWEGTRMQLDWTWLQRVVRWINRVLRLDQIPEFKSCSFPVVTLGEPTIPLDDIVCSNPMSAPVDDSIFTFEVHPDVQMALDRIGDVDSDALADLREKMNGYTPSKTRVGSGGVRYSKPGRWRKGGEK